MYKDLIKNIELFSLQLPNTMVPVPTSADYENQFIERYFLQKVNDENGFVFEIDEDTYFNYKINPYWKAEIMRWRIAGPLETIYDTMGNIIDIGVKKSNEGSIRIVSDKIKNIRLYLPNILQFYK